jgi:Flp pilus assembly protein TadD
MNRPAEALEELAVVRRQQPRVDTRFEVSCYLLEAAAQDQTGNTEAARAAYLKAIALNANTPKPEIRPEWWFAKFLMQNGEGRQAEPVLQSLLAKSPAFAPARLALAEILCAGGDYTAAIEQANLGLENSSDIDDQRRAHAFLSRAYHLAGNEDAARVHAEWVEPK